MVRTSRSLINPASNKAATAGRRSRSATPRWVWCSAMPWLTLSAAASSAATAASGSIHHSSRSPASAGGASGEDFGHHRQLPGPRRVLRPRPPAGSVDQRGVTQRRQVGDLGQRTIEHAFESTAAPPTKPPGQPLPVDETTTVDNSVGDPRQAYKWDGPIDPPDPRSRHSRRTYRAPDPRPDRAQRRR